MKTVLLRWTCLWMAALVLLTSTGLTTYAHACRIHGTVRISFSAPKKCCPAKRPVSDQPTVKRAGCCQIEAQYQHVPVAPAPVVTNGTASPIVAALPELSVRTWVPMVPESSQPMRFQHSPAPPLSGRDRLLFFQSLLI